MTPDPRHLEAEVARILGLRPPRVLTPEEQAAALQHLGDVIATVRSDDRFRAAVGLLLATLDREGVLP